MEGPVRPRPAWARRQQPTRGAAPARAAPGLGNGSARWDGAEALPGIPEPPPDGPGGHIAAGPPVPPRPPGAGPVPGARGARSPVSALGSDSRGGSGSGPAGPPGRPGPGTLPKCDGGVVAPGTPPHPERAGEGSRGLPERGNQKLVLWAVEVYFIFTTRTVGKYLNLTRTSCPAGTARRGHLFPGRALDDAELCRPPAPGAAAMR